VWRDRGGAWAERFSGCKGGEEKKVKEPHGSTEMIKNRGEERAAEGFESRQVHCMEKGLTARLKVRCDHMLKTRDWKRKKLPVVLLLVKITNVAIAYH